MIAVITRKGRVLLNPKYIQRVSLAADGSGFTVIDVAGQTYGTWCEESVEEIEQMLLQHNQQIQQ